MYLSGFIRRDKLISAFLLFVQLFRLRILSTTILRLTNIKFKRDDDHLMHFGPCGLSLLCFHLLPLFYLFDPYQMLKHTMHALLKPFPSAKYV